MSGFGARILKIAIESILHPLTPTELGSATASNENRPAEDSSSAPVTRSVRKPKAVAATALLVSPPFKLIFLTVVALTVLSGGAQILLAQIWPSPSENQQQVFESLGFAWKAGIGAIIGLLGGKAT